MLESVGIKPGCKMSNALREEDNIRIYHATQKTNIDTRLKRRKQRADKKSAGRTKPTTYLAGGFGLSKHPEVDLNNEDIDNIEVDFSKFDIAFVDDSMSISIHDYV